MPQSLPPLTNSVPIVDAQGAPNLFLLLRWQDLINSFTATPTLSNDEVASALTAALATTTLFTTLVSGRYRVTVYLEKTVADGVSSSLTPTIGWTRAGSPLTNVGAALTTDAIGANASYTHTFDADASAAITLAVAYASNTPATMTWSGWATVERLV